MRCVLAAMQHLPFFVISSSNSGGVRSHSKVTRGHGKVGVTVARRKRALLPIAEYCEETPAGSGMWSTALEALLTALRLLAPAALLTLFWGQQSLIFRFLHHFDRAFKPVSQAKDSSGTAAVKWLNCISAKRVKSLDAVWTNGAILCDILDSIVPGSCPGHELGYTSLAHAQRIAEKALGISSAFTEQELESSKGLTVSQEWRLANYLLDIRNAIGSLSPPISKQGSPRIMHDIQAYTLDYVARGMGLVTAEIGMKAIFYIYPTAQQSLEPGDVSVHIRGPDQCHGSILVPALYGKGHLSINSVTSLLGPAYYRNSGIENHYYIPKIKQDISIDLSIRHDHVRIYYIPSKPGRHEISLISKGCNIVGSPFKVTVPESRPERRNSVEMNDDIEIIREREKTARKVVYRIVDFVTEKMVLTEDGNLEKITEEEAEMILHGAGNHAKTNVKNKRFKYLTQKIQTMLRVINGFRRKEESNSMSFEIPDLVNFTRPMKIPNENDQTYYYKTKTEDLQPKAVEKTITIENIDIPNIISEISEAIADESNMKIVANKPTIVVCTDDDAILNWDIEGDELENDTIERPKTPVFKFLANLGIAPAPTLLFNSIEHNSSDIAVECFNPSIDRVLTPDVRAEFKIGAPVTNLPPMKSPSPEPNMDLILQAPNLEEALHQYYIRMKTIVLKNDESKSLQYSSALPTIAFENMTDSDIIDFYRRPLDGSTPEQFDSLEDYSGIESVQKSPVEPWDSAYVSIDDINSSPESIFKNDNTQNDCFTPIQEDDEYFGSPDSKRKNIETFSNAEFKKERDFNRETDHFDKSIQSISTFTTIKEEESSNPFLIGMNPFRYDEHNFKTVDSASVVKSDVKRQSPDKPKRWHLSETHPNAEPIQESYAHQPTKDHDVVITMSDDILTVEQAVPTKRYLKNSLKRTESIFKEEPNDKKESLVLRLKNYWNERIQKTEEEKAEFEAPRSKKTYKWKSQPNMVKAFEESQKSTEINFRKSEENITNIPAAADLSDNTTDDEELKIFESSPKRYFARALSKDKLTCKINAFYEAASENRGATTEPGSDIEIKGLVSERITKFSRESPKIAKSAKKEMKYFVDTAKKTINVEKIINRDKEEIRAEEVVSEEERKRVIDVIKNFEKIAETTKHKNETEVIKKMTENNATVDVVRKLENDVGVCDVAVEQNHPEEERHVFKESFRSARLYFEALEGATPASSPPLSPPSHPDDPNEGHHLPRGVSDARAPPPAFADRRKRKARKSHSAPTSDTEYESWDRSFSKLVKISERFHVEDLFKDVAGEGALRRSGSLRGIPRRNAVLAAFRSIESLNGAPITSYEHTASQLEDFAENHGVATSQTYHSEYPYLPTTDPQNYRSRFHAEASGMITRRELLSLNKKSRRYSVPDAWKTTFVTDV